MNELLVKKELNEKVTYTEFLEDMDVLFRNLKELYGMYHYFGAEKFEKAQQHMRELPADAFFLREAIEELKKMLSFIEDGHFYIGEAKPYVREYDYAIRYLDYHGVPMIECKKFWADDEEEKRQLEEFGKKGAQYRTEDPLILDFRGNYGGSSEYAYDFLEGLTGCEVGFPRRFLQRWSPLYAEWLKSKGINWTEDDAYDEWVVEKPGRIPNKKKIYVLFDDRTASAAEEPLAVLQNMENAVLVGEHSAGKGSCGNCIAIYLPHSHIKAYFGTGLLLYDGVRNVDAEGGFSGDISFAEFEKLFEK